MISVSSTPEMLTAMHTARHVTFAAYFLKRGSIVEGLKQAAKRGAHVEVRLDGALYGGTARWSAESRTVARALRRSGADVKFLHRDKHDGPGVHIKAAVCDHAAFLDDCNWARGGDTVMRDDTPAHLRAIRGAVLRREGCGIGALALTKYAALKAESAALRCGSRAGTVEVETEELGASAVSRTLRELLARHVHCRVLVSEWAFKNGDHRTHDAALSLQKAGADVRMTKASEKLTIAGARAWVGSANASSPYYNGGDIDWSLATADPHIIRSLKAHFANHWRASFAIPKPAAHPKFVG